MRNYSKDNVRNYCREPLPRTLTGEKVTSNALKESEVRVGKYKYDISEELGRGFSSNVYKGVQILKPHKRYAIKVINLKKFRGTNIDLLEAEINIHRSLEHENIVRLYQVIKTSHHYYLILEYCPHGNLGQYIVQKKQLTQNNALEISVQIFSAYRYLLAEGVIHRDIKPANVLRAGNKWKLSDFGFAVRSRFGFKDRMNVGTPLYMAPQSLRRNYYSPKSDIYSLGIVLFEMLVGRTPHEADSEKQLIDRLGNQIILPKTLKNVKLIQFITRACAMNDIKRLSRQQFQVFDLGIFLGQQPSLTPSLHNCSSLVSLKQRKTSGGATTDDSESKNGQFSKREFGSNSLSKQPSKNTSRDVSIYGKNINFNSQQTKINKNPMIANKQQLAIELQYVHHFYFTIQNIESFHLEDNIKSMFMLMLFKLLLKILRLLCDKGNNHFQLTNWQEYQQCKLHQDFYASLNVHSQKYEKEYLQFIKHNDIKVIRAVNRKFPELCHTAPLTQKFYENLRSFMLEVLKDHSEQVTNLTVQNDDQLNDRYEAFFSAYAIYRLGQVRANDPLVKPPEKIQPLSDYTLSKRTKSDYLAARRTVKVL